MRLPAAVVPAALVLLALAAGALARPRDAQLGRLAADGPVSLASDRPGVALLEADRIKPGDSVSGTVSLTNKGDRAGTLDLGVSGVHDRPGAYGGLLSSVLRLRVEDLGGTLAPLETTVGDGATLALGRLAGGETRAYRVTATFPDGGLPPGPFAGDNLEQGSSVEVALQWQLTAADPAPTATATPAATPAPASARPAPRPAAPRPLLTLRVPFQRVFKPRGITAFAQCEIACEVRFTARTETTPRGGRRRRTLQRRHVLGGERRWRALPAGSEQRIYLKLRANARRRLRRQLHRRRRVGIVITAHMRSPAGNRVARRRIVMRIYKPGERRTSAFPA